MHFYFNQTGMKVLKFGGTSVGSPERIRGIRKIVESQKVPCIVVLSAFQGITDELKHVSELAAARNEEYRAVLAKIELRHNEVIRHLIPGERQQDVMQHTTQIYASLEETLSGIWL